MNTHVRVSKILFDFSLCHKYLWVNIYLQVMEQRSFLLYSVWIFNEILRLDASNDSIRKQGNERWRVKVEQEYSLYEIAYGFYYVRSYARIVMEKWFTR